MHSKNYRPVSCKFYDELTLLSLHRKKSHLQIKHENGNTKGVQGIILDLFTREKVEYLKMDSGEIIRLDVIECINGRPVAEFK